MTEAIARMDDADSIPKARLLYFSTPFMSPRSSSILTEDGAELPSRSKKKKSGGFSQTPNERRTRRKERVCFDWVFYKKMNKDMDSPSTEPQALREVLEGLAVSQRHPRGACGTADGGPTEDDPVHTFWDTQPVPRLGEDMTMHMDMGPIDPPDVDAVRKDPYHLPPSFEWSDVDLEDSEQTHELYLLLHAAVGRTLVKLRNLIHESCARQARELCGGRRQHVSFRCAHEKRSISCGLCLIRSTATLPDYSVAFLRWALTPPGSRTEWMVRRRVVLP